MVCQATAGDQEANDHRRACRREVGDNAAVEGDFADVRRADRKSEREAPRRHKLQCQQLLASAALDEQRRGILNEAANSKCCIIWNINCSGIKMEMSSPDYDYDDSRDRQTLLAAKLRGCEEVHRAAHSNRNRKLEKKSTSLAEGNLCEELNADVMAPTEEREDPERSCTWPAGRGPQDMCATSGGGPTRVPNLCVRAPFVFWVGHAGEERRSHVLPWSDQTRGMVPSVRRTSEEGRSGCLESGRCRHVAKATTVLTYLCSTAAVFPAAQQWRAARVTGKACENGKDLRLPDIQGLSE